MYESEGWANFKETYGDKAFGLNHRCYWHLDSQSKLWLSAEDGCEGVYPPRAKRCWASSEPEIETGISEGQRRCAWASVVARETSLLCSAAW